MNRLGKKFDEIVKQEAQKESRAVKLLVGDKETEGAFVVGLSIKRAPEGFEVHNLMEGYKVGPVELVAMLDALDNVREKLTERLVTSTIKGVFGELLE